MEIIEEMIQIGRGASFTLNLNDPLLQNEQISVVRRGGRHAIYVDGSDQVELEGTKVPPDRWVWLPQKASVQLTRRTALEFESLLSVTESDFDTPATAPVPTIRASLNRVEPVNAANGSSVSAPASVSSAATVKKSASNAVSDSSTKTATKAKPAVARFITDQGGDPFVKLGEDGHLPDLELQEVISNVPQRQVKDEKSNTMTLILVFVVSVGMSMAMLFIDLEMPSSSMSQSRVARNVITIFYGSDDAPLEPYQKLLRRANWAHSQGNYQVERQLFREVLKLLRAENKNSLIGLTRLSPEAQRKFDQISINDLKALHGATDEFLDLKNDDRLERLLSILLTSR